MGLASGESAIYSAVIYNAFIIVALIPLALKGVKYREVSAGSLLGYNLMVYGLGGIIAPFIAIKAIDIAITALDSCIREDNGYEDNSKIICISCNNNNYLRIMLYAWSFRNIADSLSQRG